MDPSWVHLGPILEPLGSLADPSGITMGQKLDPTWNQPGFFFDPSWILGGSFELFGSLADPSGIIARLKLGPNLQLGHFGTLVVPLGSILEPWWVTILPYINNIGPLSDLAWSLGGTLLVQLWIHWNHFGSFADPSGKLPGSSLDPAWD